MPSTSDKPTDKISLAQAVRWIETRAGAPGKSLRGPISRASADQVHEALKAGAIRATGCIDGRRREPISADEWHDYDLILRHISFLNAQFMKAPGMPVVEAISKRLYPAAAVNLRYRRSALRLPSAQSETGEPGYHRVIVDVLLSCADVLAHWPRDGLRQTSLRERQKKVRTRPLRERAEAAIRELYPTGVPNQTTEPNVTLCRKVAEAMSRSGRVQISDDTILRAAGRRRN